MLTRSSQSFLVQTLSGLECHRTDPEPPPPPHRRVAAVGVGVWEISAREGADALRLSWGLGSGVWRECEVIFKQKIIMTNVSREWSSW